MQLPPVLRALVPDAGGPRLVCLHHRKFEDYAVAFRWEHPVSFSVEALVIAAADAAPAAFREVTLAVTSVDVGENEIYSDPMGGPGPRAGPVIGAAFSLAAVVRALSSRPDAGIAILEQMQRMGVTRFLVATTDP